MTIDSHQSLSPKMAAKVVTPQVQYSTSCRYSVRPLASRSSPGRFRSPVASCVGRAMLSNQSSIPSAGPASREYSMYVFRVQDDRKTKKRSTMKKRLTTAEIRWTRLRTAVFRAASCFAAFCDTVSGARKMTHSSPKLQRVKHTFAIVV